MGFVVLFLVAGDTWGTPFEGFWTARVDFIVEKDEFFWDDKIRAFNVPPIFVRRILRERCQLETVAHLLWYSMELNVRR